MELAAFAKINFGLDEREFYKLTPKKYDALARAHLQAVRLHYLPIAKLNCSYINAHLGEDDDPISPADLFPGIFPSDEPPIPQQSPEEVKAIFEQLAIDQRMDYLNSIDKRNQQS